jgi:hypothetical protein
MTIVCSQEILWISPQEPSKMLPSKILENATIVIAWVASRDVFCAHRRSHNFCAGIRPSPRRTDGLYDHSENRDDRKEEFPSKTFTTSKESSKALCVPKNSVGLFSRLPAITGLYSLQLFSWEFRLEVIQKGLIHKRKMEIPCSAYSSVLFSSDRIRAIGDSMTLVRAIVQKHLFP